MKKILLSVILILSVSLMGCAKSLKYSQEEIKDFPPPIQDHIKNHEITLGMTKLQVRYSWGGSDTINILPPAEGGKERVEWIYKKLEVFKTRLIFTDDKLTEIISNELGIVR